MSAAVVAAWFAAFDRWVCGSGPLGPSALARTEQRAPVAPPPKLWPLPARCGGCVSARGSRT